MVRSARQAAGRADGFIYSGGRVTVGWRQPDRERCGQGGVGTVAAVMDAAGQAVPALGVAAVVGQGDGRDAAEAGGGGGLGLNLGLGLRCRHDHDQRQQQSADEA